MGIFDKYQPVGSTQPAQTGSVFSKYQPLPAEKPWYENMGNAVVGGMNAVAQAGASAAGQVAKGAGNLAKVAGENLSYLDPIADAQRVKELATGSGFGYTAPSQILGNAISQGANTIANNAVKASEQGGKNEVAQAFGRIYGDIGTSVGTAALTPQIGTSGFLGKILPQSLIDTGFQTAASTGRSANMGDYATGAALDSAFYGAGKLLKGIGKTALASIPNFTNKQASANELKALGSKLYENVDQIPLTKDRPTLGESFSKLAQGEYGKKTDIINKAMETTLPATKNSGQVINQTLDKAYADTLKESALKKAGISLDQMPKAIEGLDKIKEFYQQAANKGFSLAELEKFKESFGKKLFSNSALETLDNTYRKNIRKGVKDLVESGVEQSLGQGGKDAFKAAKENYAVLAKSAQRLKDTPKASSGILGDIISGSTAAAGSLAQGNVGNAIKSAATAVGAKRALTSPVTKIAAAKGIKALEDLLKKSGGNKTIPLLLRSLIQGGVQSNAQK